MIVATGFDKFVEVFLNVSMKFAMFPFASFDAIAFDEPLETDQTSICACRGVSVELVKYILEIFVVLQDPSLVGFVLDSLGSLRTLRVGLWSVIDSSASVVILCPGELGVVCGELEFQEIGDDIGKFSSLDVVMSLVKAKVAVVHLFPVSEAFTQL